MQDDRDEWERSGHDGKTVSLKPQALSDINTKFGLIPPETSPIMLLCHTYRFRIQGKPTDYEPRLVKHSKTDANSRHPELEKANKSPSEVWFNGVEQRCAMASHAFLACVPRLRV